MKALTSVQFERALVISKFRVKIKSLGDEARTIRFESSKRSGLYLSGTYGEFVSGRLDHHRRFVVRPEVRYTLLAYAYYRGKPYASVERPAEDNRPKVSEIERVLRSMVGRKVEANLSDWLSGWEVAGVKQSA